MKTLLVFVLLFMAVPVQAQTALRISEAAAITAHAADLATTEYCLGQGRCRELNPWLARFDSPGLFGAAKMAVASMSEWGIAKLAESHPKLAIVANWLIAGSYSVIAIHNARTGQP